MKFVTISDVHVKNNKCENYKLLLNFLEREEVLSSKLIFFLGDIFDVMCGQHGEYYEEYSLFFDKISIIANQGIQIHYFEGNHDVNLKKLFENLFKSNKNIFLHEGPIVRSFDDKKMYFSHGDELNFDDKVYIRYKNFITSKFAKLLSNHVIPYGFLDYYAKAASRKSRKINDREYDEEKIKLETRHYVEELEVEFDYAFCGHTHVQDLYCFGENSRKTYVNNGYFPKKRNFILYNNGDINFCYVSLT